MQSYLCFRYITTQAVKALIDPFYTVNFALCPMKGMILVFENYKRQDLVFAKFKSDSNN